MRIRCSMDIEDTALERLKHQLSIPLFVSWLFRVHHSVLKDGKSLKLAENGTNGKFCLATPLQRRILRKIFVCSYNYLVSMVYLKCSAVIGLNASKVAILIPKTKKGPEP